MILIWIWALVFGTPIIRILALYLDFEGAKNIDILKFLIWGFGRYWMFLTGVWYLDLYLDMVRNLDLMIPEVFIILRAIEAKISSVETEK